jgi:beta-aspartyl-peptidase (threonine type)
VRSCTHVLIYKLTVPCFSEGAQGATIRPNVVTRMAAVDRRSRTGMAPLPTCESETTGFAAARNDGNDLPMPLGLGRQPAAALRRWRPVLAMMAVLAAIALVRYVAKNVGASDTDGPSHYAIAIHGGAGTIDRRLMSPELIAEYRDTLQRSTAAGEAVLMNGGTAMDAVVAAVQVMELSELFNAGRGAVFTHAGTNEMDAAVMDGRAVSDGGDARGGGAVAGVSATRSPIACARAVYDQSRHNMLSGAGADEFCSEQGLPEEDTSYFYTERRWAQLLKGINSSESQLSESEGRRNLQSTLARNEGASEAGKRDWGDLSPDSPAVNFDIGKMGTVGAVARDQAGHLAAATSTGGTSNKLYGRIGDSPILGAGTWAKDATCAISATGHGEVFIREAAASQVSARMEYGGATLGDAMDATLAGMESMWPNVGGMVGIDNTGSVIFGYTTGGMYRAWRSGDGSQGTLIWDD